MSESWQGYMCIGNGWGETITDVTFVHSLKGSDHKDTINVPSMAVGDVSEVLAFVAYSNMEDDWSISFYDSNGVEKSASFSNAGFKNEDQDGILFAQITNENDRATLYFPVSSDEHTGL